MGTINLLHGIYINKLKIIKNDKGEVLKGLRSDEKFFNGFGEAYFSKIKFQSIKGWKLHKKMTMNLIVPYGAVKFVFFDDRKDSITNGKFCEHILSKENYCRLTVSPNIWFAFMGLNKEDSIVLNLSNIIHDENEVEGRLIDDIYYDWKIS